jgi:hypothetical protein
MVCSTCCWAGRGRSRLLRIQRWSRNAPPAADDDPSLIVFDAVQKQLGLKPVEEQAPSEK